jgi:hypothetical protein
MVVRLQPVADGWSGADQGATFHVRPADVRTAIGPELVESGRYSLIITGQPTSSSLGLHVHGLPHPHVVQQGLLLANLHLGHEFGDLSLQLVDGPRTVSSAVVGVGARYLDVDTDFAAIEQDLDRVAHGLAYSIWKQAAHAAYPDFTAPTGTPEWLALLDFLWERIRRGLVAIERDPDRELRHIHEVVPAGRAGALDQHGMRWLARHPDAWEIFGTHPPVASVPLAQGHVVAVRALSRRREVSLDTPANRLLKARLRRIERRIVRVIAAVPQLSAAHFAAGQRNVYRDQLLIKLRESQRFSTHGFLRDVKDDQAPTRQSSHVARTDARYRDVLRAASMLEWGILRGIGGQNLLISHRETWELYEYWVYLYLLSIFDDAGWQCLNQSAVRLSTDASVVVDLAKGAASQVQFRKMGAGPATVVTITFHKVYSSRDALAGLGPGSRSVQRDVDIVLEVQLAGAIKRAALDPKYRVELDDDGCKIAPVSAINDMHVYRDSVGRWALGLAGHRRFEPTLDVAVAVFPSHDEACASHHRFCRSIDDGIGALPLLPGSAGSPAVLLKQFVQRLAEGFVEAPTWP